VSNPPDVLEPSPDGLAQRLGGRLRTHRPAIAGGAVVVLGYIVMIALLIGLGLILTKLLVNGQWTPGTTA
jgi:hypothetical protein